MAVFPTTFEVRQFCNIPGENLPFDNTQPSDTFVVTGSFSNLLVNNTRTDLAADTIYGTNDGWFPGPSTKVYVADPEVGYQSYGVIVGGKDSFANTVSDSRTGGSKVSCYGWVSLSTQGANETAFINLASYVMQTTYANLANAKAGLQGAGYYYQFPKGMSGQSPNTGTGSDT
jgi:hypothetical protein